MQMVELIWVIKSKINNKMARPHHNRQIKVLVSCRNKENFLINQLKNVNTQKGLVHQQG